MQRRSSYVRMRIIGYTVLFAGKELRNYFLSFEKSAINSKVILVFKTTTKKTKVIQF